VIEDEGVLEALKLPIKQKKKKGADAAE